MIAIAKEYERRDGVERVAVANPEQYRPSEEELVQKAEAMCARLVESEAGYVPFTKYPAI